MLSSDLSGHFVCACRRGCVCGVRASPQRRKKRERRRKMEEDDVSTIIICRIMMCDPQSSVNEMITRHEGRMGAGAVPKGASMAPGQ